MTPWAAVPAPEPRPVVAAFDVDGTLTTRDCVVPFLRRVAGTGRARRRPRSRRRSRRPGRWRGATATRSRRIVGAVAFAGRPVADVEASGREFAAYVQHACLRPDTLDRLPGTAAQGHHVVLVSASFGVYLRPLAEALGVDGVVATELDGRGRPLHGRPRRRQLPRHREGRPPARLARRAPRRSRGGRAVGVRRLAGRPRAARRRRPRRCGPTASPDRGARGGRRERRRRAAAIGPTQAVGQEHPRVRRARRGRRARRAGASLGRTVLAFVAFCLAASGIYFWNDALDVDADRTHPTKQHRPIAAGIVPVRHRARWSARCCRSSPSAWPR